MANRAARSALILPFSPPAELLTPRDKTPGGIVIPSHGAHGAHARSSEPAPDSSSALGVYPKEWLELAAHISKWFYDPDLGALEIVLSACVAHFHKGADPAWLLVIGPSSGDKSSVMANCCLAVESSHLMGDLTAKTFLSGYTGMPNSSFLHRIGSGILVFKDFTTFISKRLEERADIAGQMREVYDGSFSKQMGKGITLEWHGKVTTIACGTPQLEHAWSELRGLGERFLQVRIPKRPGIPQACAAQAQAGMEEFISTHMRKLVTNLMRATPAITYPPPKLSKPQIDRIAHMAEVVAHCRGNVPRSPKTDEITGLAEVEGAPRASKILSSTVTGHASLMRRDTISDTFDMWCAARLARNSIPIERYMLVNFIAANPGCTLGDLVPYTGLKLSTCRRHLDDLFACSMLEVGDSNGENTYRLTEEMTVNWKVAFAPFTP